MKLKDHIAELKRLLVTKLVIGTVLFFIFFFMSEYLINLLLTYYGIKVYALSPIESINVQMNFSFILTLIILLPLLILDIMKFIQPAYELKKFKRNVIQSLTLSIIGYIVGITIFSKVILNSLVSSSVFETMISASSIFSFANIMGIALAITFNIILIIPLLVKYNIINTTYLNKSRPVIIIVTLLFAGIITPGIDIFSQMVISVPMLVSFETGTTIAKLMKINNTEVLT
jgi:sec-independent protein translocase protein TatC